jgi:hypothetical protein
MAQREKFSIDPSGIHAEGQRTSIRGSGNEQAATSGVTTIGRTNGGGVEGPSAEYLGLKSGQSTTLTPARIKLIIRTPRPAR